jgi:hypothetical protein
MKNFSEIREAAIADAAMTVLLFKFGVMMTRSFTKWDAFKTGVIDADGEIIKEPETAAEKKSFGKLERFVLKIKKTMLRYVKSEKLLAVLVYAYILKAESPNLAILELEEVITIEERNDLIEFVKGYYNQNKDQF